MVSFKTFLTLCEFVINDVHHAAQILGVHNTNNPDDIKQAYRKQAMQWHPDRFANGSDEDRNKATERFKMINAAYQFLSNPKNHQAPPHGFNPHGSTPPPPPGAGQHQQQHQQHTQPPPPPGGNQQQHQQQHQNPHDHFAKGFGDAWNNLFNTKMQDQPPPPGHKPFDHAEFTKQQAATMAHGHAQHAQNMGGNTPRPGPTGNNHWDDFHSQQAATWAQHNAAMNQANNQFAFKPAAPITPAAPLKPAGR